MRSLLSFRPAVIALALSVAAVPALHAQKVSTDYDHHADFKSFHTFSFYRVQTADPLYEQRIKDAITHDLQSRGWQMVPSGGDISITAIGDVKDAQEYNTFYNGLGPGFGWRGWGWWGGGWGAPETTTTTVEQVPIGTLLVDLYDNQTHNLVFRGRATDELHRKHTDKNIEIVDKEINKMFDHFPPK